MMTSEQATIELAKNGDHQAFLQLLKLHDRQIMSVIYRFTGNLYDREDLYQEIFLHVFKAMRKFRQESSFETWLYRIALNRCIEYMKKHKPCAPLDEQEDIPDQQGPDWEQNQKMRAVHRALAQLKGPQRICFHLHYIEDWTAEQIANTLGCGTGSVKTHLFRAREKVRKHREVSAWMRN